MENATAAITIYSFGEYELDVRLHELRRANEMVKSASVFFATELDGRTRQ